MINALKTLKCETKLRKQQAFGAKDQKFNRLVLTNLVLMLSSSYKDALAANYNNN